MNYVEGPFKVGDVQGTRREPLTLLMVLVVALRLPSSESRNCRMSRIKIQCYGAAGLSIRHTIKGKLALMVGELWLTSKFSSIFASDLAAFISAPGNTFLLVLSQS